MNKGRLRIVLYSHDTMGIGHMRRNQLIAQTLARPPREADILMIAGAREANAFVMPPGVDCLTLPSLRKGKDGCYKPRCLNVSLEELGALRTKVIGAAMEAFKPDVLIVDKVPRGAVRELDPILEDLRTQGLTRCVLGLRDVLDDPDTVRREWRNAANEEAIERYYDAIWVYGDRSVYDPVSEYRLPSGLAAKVRYTGYLDRHVRAEEAEAEDMAPLPDLALPPGRLVLCMVGGGQDGARLAEAFVDAELPPETNAVVMTGPFMPTEVRNRLRRLAAARPRLRVLEFVTGPEPLLSRADRVIAMGGYNTVCEVLSYEKHALIVPRVEPRREQLVRVERLRELGLLDFLHPDEVGPEALAGWLARDLGPPPRVRDRVDLNGLARLPGLLDEVIAAPPRTRRGRSRGGAVEHVSS